MQMQHIKKYQFYEKLNRLINVLEKTIMKHMEHFRNLSLRTLRVREVS